MSLTYLGHSAIMFEVSGSRLYVDPYFKDPVDWTKLPKGDLVLLSHGHFDHGVLMAAKLFEAWHCRFVGPQPLVKWMARKYRRRIPTDALISLNQNESLGFGSMQITAVPAHHPINRLGKTILQLFSASSAPGKPVNGYHFSGYYHAGDTIYTSSIAEALQDVGIHTACLPIGGKYAVASPQEALRIAEEIGAKRLVPLHWQPLMQQVPFRYQSSDLVKLANSLGAKIAIHPLAIGERLELAEET